MLHIIITVDYEIFGNGKGDVKSHIVKPMNKIIDAANKYNVPITIMFEACEYITFKKYDHKLRRDLGYSPMEIIKDQIREAYSLGHDVQLHIHPQFVNMKYENRKFVLEDPKKTIEDFSIEEVEEILRKGIEAVREVTGDTNKNVEVLRLSNMPWDEAPHAILPIMEKLGFKAHSLATTSHRNNTSLNRWRINNSEILEIPIYSQKIKILEYFTLKRLFILGYIKLHNRDNLQIKSNGCRTLKNIIDAKWDLSKLTYRQMIKFLDQAIAKYDYLNNEISLVMIGHTKDFFNQRNFEKFLREVTGSTRYEGIVRFSKFSDFVNEVSKNESFVCK